MSGVAAVILAAGMSTRLGRPKQTLLLDGEPLVAHVGRRLKASKAQRVMAVVGANANNVRAALDEYVDEFVTNEAFAEGQGTSIAVPIAYVDILGDLLGTCDAILYVLADQPGIQTDVIDNVIDAWLDGARIVMAQYDDCAGHPVLFDRQYWPELEALRGDQGGRHVIARHQSAVTYVRVAGNAPMDVDTEADWRTLQEFWDRGE